MNKYLYTAIVAILSSFMTTLICGLATIFFVVLPFNKEAVDRGFASWEVTNNATGATKFTWNEFAQGLHPENPDNVLASMEIQ